MTTTHELRQQVRALLADERGTIRKQARRRVALLYPSPYRAGMSSLGFQVMYRAINERDDWVAERVFLPEDPSAYRSSRTPLFTFESEVRVDEVDLVAVSLAYELEISGLLDCLDLAGIPLRAEERSEVDPLVVLGGPLTFSNPLPVAPFVDALVMGEGEGAIVDVLDAVESEVDRDAVLSRLAAIPHVHVPAIHGERLLPVGKANEAALPARGQILTPSTELADMHLVEAARGCHRRCTFCVMRRSMNDGMRAADPMAILSSVPEEAGRVGLVGAAVTDHPKLREILRSLIGSGREVGLSSLRADRLDEELVALLGEAGYRTLTVASDGASERLRATLQKSIRTSHLLGAARLVVKHELRQIKIYVMIGVPGETDEDIDELVELGREVAGICRVVFGIAPFVSKRNTPLDRRPFAGIRQLDATLKRLRRDLGSHVDLRSASARWAWVEWCLAQGGYDMADAAEAAWRAGGSFSAWKRAIGENRLDAQPADADLRLGLPTGRFAHEALP